MKIALDPGHGGIFAGAIGTVPFELREKDVTLAICQKVSKLLRKSGHRAILTRQRDINFATSINKDIRKRAEIANEAEAEYLVSVHCGAYSDPNPEGIETWFRPNFPKSEELARTLHGALISRFPEHLNRGAKPKDLLLFRHAEMPACQLEIEFLTNPTQLEFLASSINQEKIAAAIVAGITQLK